MKKGNFSERKFIPTKIITDIHNDLTTNNSNTDLATHPKTTSNNNNFKFKYFI